MALKVVDSLYSKLPKQLGALDGSTAITQGQLLYHDTANGVLKTATSSAGTTLNIAGIAAQTVASGGTSVEYIPVDQAVFIEADCTNSTASNQLHKAHAMTSGAAVANTSSTVATTLGVFFALRQVGAATDKKLYGYFIKIGQVTA